MSHLFGGGGGGSLPPIPPPVPLPNQQQIASAQQKAIQLQTMRSGRMSTILNPEGAAGLGGQNTKLGS